MRHTFVYAVQSTRILWVASHLRSKIYGRAGACGLVMTVSTGACVTHKNRPLACFCVVHTFYVLLATFYFVLKCSNSFAIATLVPMRLLE